MPIGHITNGIHVGTWLALQMRSLFDRNIGSEWSKKGGEAATWEKIGEVDDGELWETHQLLKLKLINFVRWRAVWQAERRSESPVYVEQCRRSLSPDALTIGFARRFATYKRRSLILRDLRTVRGIGQRSATAGSIRVCRKGAPARPPW